MSKRRTKESRIYSCQRKAYLEAHPRCQFDSCENRSTEIHHIAKRGKNYLNEATFSALCSTCHRYIEEHKSWARENGWLQ